jgi:hypothetical protein
MRKAILVSALILLVLPSLVSAADYYVAQNNPGGCNNGWDGTEIQPFCTIQMGVDYAVAGDTIYIKEGVYHEHVDIMKSGGPGNYIKLVRYKNDTVVLDGTGNSNRRGSNPMGYIWIEGIEITNWDSDGIRGYEGTNHNVFMDIYTHHNPRGSGIYMFHGSGSGYHKFIRVRSSHNGGHGLKVHGYDNYFKDCEAWENGQRSGFDIGVGCAGIQLSDETYGSTIIEGGRFYDNGINRDSGSCHGIRWCVIPGAGETALIANVTVYGNRFRGISFECSGVSHDTTIRNSNIYGNRESGIWIVSGTRDITIEDNCIHENRDYGVKAQSGASGIEAIGNVIFGNIDGVMTSNVIDTGNIFQDDGTCHVTPQCSDGIDNDGDGMADYPSDPDCFDPSDDKESGDSVDCGNLLCDPGECDSCLGDCTFGDCCGIEGCNPGVGENCSSCPDCPCGAMPCIEHDCTDMVVWFDFDQISGGLASDSSPYHNDGQISGVTQVSGRIGTALEFDGASGYVEAGDSASLDLQSQVSITAWIYPVSVNSWDRIVAKSHSSSGYPYTMYGLLFDDAGHARLEIASGGTQNAVNGNAIIPLNTWSFVAGIYDGEAFRVYVDGVLENSVALSGLIDTNDMSLSIGRSGFDRHYFDGMIDEVRVYNRALSQQEVTQLHENGYIEYSRSDVSPRNGCIRQNELIDFIGLWKTPSGGIAMPELMDAIGLWKQGTGCIN